MDILADDEVWVISLFFFKAKNRLTILTSRTDASKLWYITKYQVNTTQN